MHNAKVMHTLRLIQSIIKDSIMIRYFRYKWSFL